MSVRIKKRHPKIPFPEVEGLTLKVLSYNIHQGITLSRRRIGFPLLKEAIKAVGADIVLLQEVAGSSKENIAESRQTALEASHQLEALADQIWPYQAYQKNSVFSGGFHGNAILSRFPIRRWNKLNITVKGMRKRGVLHAELAIPELESSLHVLATHLGLLQYERHLQLSQVCTYVAREIKTEHPVLIGGDFNDWREKVSPRLARTLKMEEAFLSQDAAHARTFPSNFPVLRLDRIYFRGFHLKAATLLKGKPWKMMSDHLPVVAHFVLPGTLSDRLDSPRSRRK
jgi:endonuclease/exonuclease/phosphatase family metal-dependent hydrolase